MNATLGGFLGLSVGLLAQNPDGARAMAMLIMILGASFVISCALWFVWHCMVAAVDLVRDWFGWW